MQKKRKKNVQRWGSQRCQLTVKCHMQTYVSCTSVYAYTSNWHFFNIHMHESSLLKKKKKAIEFQVFFYISSFSIPLSFYFYIFDARMSCYRLSNVCAVLTLTMTTTWKNRVCIPVCIIEWRDRVTTRRNWNVLFDHLETEQVNQKIRAAGLKMASSNRLYIENG